MTWTQAFRTVCAKWMSWTLPLLALLSTTATAQTCVPPPPGIIAWWPFDETGGVIANDIAGEHPGAYFDGPTPVAGQVGGALHFNGSSSFVGTADSDLWAFGQTAFTIEFWANFDQPGGGSLAHPGTIFIGNDEGPTNRNKWFFALGGGFLNFHINSPTLGARFFPLAPFSPEIHRWYHLALTRNGSLYTIFIDGRPTASVLDSNAVPNPASSLTIGQAESLGFMHGSLDEVTIYQRAISEAEIKAIVAAGAGGKCKDRPASDFVLSPKAGGNAGVLTVSLAGNELTPDTTFKLTRAGDSDISGNFTSVTETGHRITATFDLTDRNPGLWDVALVRADRTYKTLPHAFEIESGGSAQPWVNVIGRGAVRQGVPQSFHILYGNRGSVDALGVPIWIAVPKEVVWHLGFEITPPSAAIQNTTLDFSQVPIAITAGQETLIPILIPVIPPETIRNMDIVITFPKTQPFAIRAWANPPILNTYQSYQDCMNEILKFALEEQGLFPTTDKCLRATLELMRTIITTSIDLARQKGSADETKLALTQLTVAPFITVFRCIAVEFPEAEVIALALDWLNKGLGLLRVVEKCRDASSMQSEGDLQGLSLGSLDPNVKVGSPGKNVSRSVSPTEALSYAIVFENVENATAPAQEVIVNDLLDTTRLDLSTLRIGSLYLGNTKLTLPPNSTAYTTLIDLRPERNLLVRIEASLNVNTGLLTWRFTSLDPATGLSPEDPLAGFLPPNVNPPEGEGSVLFTVMPKRDLPTGTEIRNRATIVFDNNTPIETNEWLNTLDSSKPSSHILPLTTTQDDPAFEVNWSGTDEGAGVQDYTVYVSEDGAPATVWLRDTTAMSALFTGKRGKTYAFYTVARDLTGNLEDAPATPDTMTRILEDQDGDGVPDVRDNCVSIANADQSDLDGDGTGDLCDSHNIATAIFLSSRPGSVGKDKVSVAILSTRFFDAAKINPTIVTFIASSVESSRLMDVDGDGKPDLVLAFTIPHNLLCKGPYPNLHVQTRQGITIEGEVQVPNCP